MALTLGNIVERVVVGLNAFSTNRPRRATFKGWQVDASGNKTGIIIGDRNEITSNTLVELDTELVYVTSLDVNTGATACPPWFRQQDGTPANDTYPVGSRLTINPRWPRYHVASKVIDGINSLYPDLFAVRSISFQSSIVNGNYALPSDVDGILHVTIEDYSPGKNQLQIGEWSLDTNNDDGKRYLRIRPIGVARTIRVEYRARPVAPDPSNMSTPWSDTGLPDSASDIPEIFAKMMLITAAEAARTQTDSVEQSDRARLIQGGTASAASRRFQELYQSRLQQERRKLLDQFPPRPHMKLN